MHVALKLGLGWLTQETAELIGSGKFLLREQAAQIYAGWKRILLTLAAGLTLLTILWP
jgi:hypothetical protein